MKNHHTKVKGDKGVLKVQVDLYEQGYITYTTNSEHQSFDLIAYKDGGVFKRVQVKYRSLSERGTLNIKFQNSYADKNGSHRINVDKSEIDLYAIYCPETDECYYINPQEYNKNVSLRIKSPKNKQNKNILFAKDFQRVP